MNWFQKILAWFGLLILVSCTTAPVINVPAQPPLITAPTNNGSCQNGKWCPIYDSFIVVNITVDMKNWNQGPWCPKGTNPFKFWPAFVKSISDTESGWDNNNVYEEPNVYDSQGNHALSIGLLQLSRDDQISYPNAAKCKGITDASLKDYAVNLPCGLQIMDTLIAKGKPLSSYWSSLNLSKSNGQETLSHMKANLPECF